MWGKRILALFWLKTTAICSLTVVEARSPKQGVGRARLPLWFVRNPILTHLSAPVALLALILIKMETILYITMKSANTIWSIVEKSRDPRSKRQEAVPNFQKEKEKLNPGIYRLRILNASQCWFYETFMRIPRIRDAPRAYKWGKISLNKIKQALVFFSEALIC